MPVFTRMQFYELLWSAPASTLAKTLGISDVALGKAAKRHGIPAPERGYWAKVAAGKRAPKAKLPPRGLGQADSIRVGRQVEPWPSSAGGPDPETLPLPDPVKAHDESLEDLLARLRREIGTVGIPKSLTAPHPVVAKMLDIDAKRIEKFSGTDYRWSHEQPYYASAYEKRRLRLLSALFKALSKAGLSVDAKGKHPNQFRVFAPEGAMVTFRLDHPQKTDPRDSYFAASAPDRPASDPLMLEIEWWSRSKAPFQREWRDGKGAHIEQAVSDIAATLALAVEATYRPWEIDAHQLAIERHRQAIQRNEEVRLQAIRAREAAEEEGRQVRVHKLLSDASSFRLAEDIRHYVAAVVAANKQSQTPVPPEEMSAWQRSALLCADDIDPVLSKAFLEPARPLPAPAANHPTASATLQSRLGTDAPWHPNQFAHYHRKD